jgi:outer membrane protein assembly factor BamA
MLHRFSKSLALALCALILACVAEGASKKPIVKTDKVNINPAVKSIKVTGSGPIPANTIIGMMKTKVGKTLDIDVLMRDMQTIQEYYHKQGYLALVRPEVGVNSKGVLIVPILLGRVEKISLIGVPQANQKAVLGAMKTKAGAIYNAQTLKQDVRALQSTGAAPNARETVTPSSKAGFVRVTLRASSKKTS